MGAGLLRHIAETAASSPVDLAFAREMLARVTPREVGSWLDALARDERWLEAAGALAYDHANGFLKVPLAEAGGARVRLHYWPGGVRGEENVHDHRWDLASRILAGTLENEVFATCQRAKGGLVARGYRYVKAAPGLGAEVVDVGARALRRVRRQALGPGEVYALPHTTLHRIADSGSGPTITLMVQSAPVRAHNLMFCPDVESPDVCPVPLGSARLSGRLREAASLLAAA
jgi:hypothetical protein